MQAELRVIGGKQQGKVIPLTMKKFLIGREKDCHLRPNNDLISRHHCVLTVDEFTVRIRDLGSTNGTFVNSERIQGQTVLQHGDQLGIGKLLFEIAIKDVAAPEAVLPAEEAALLETDAMSNRPTPQPATTNPEMDTTIENAAANETVTLPVQSVDVEVPPGGVYGGDTVSLPAQPQTPPEGYPQQQPMGAMPPGQIQPLPGMPPGQFAPQPMQQFPQQMPMMPQQFPMMPQQFPQPIPMMPHPVQMAPQPYPNPTEVPGSVPPVTQEQPTQAGAEETELDVRLPPPEQTGASQAADELGSTGSPSTEAAPSGQEVDPRTAAADIIRQYTHRPLSQE